MSNAKTIVKVGSVTKFSGGEKNNFETNIIVLYYFSLNVRVSDNFKYT